MATHFLGKAASLVTSKPQVVEKGHGIAKKIVGTVEVTTAMIDNADDNIILTTIPKEARITKLLLAVDDLDTHVSATLAFNVGLFKLDSDGDSVTVVDADAFASAVLHDTVKGAFVDVAFEARGIEKVEKTAFELGVAVDTSLKKTDTLFIGLDITTAAATAAAGTISFIIEFIE